MGPLNQLETSLAGVFKGAPKLPKGFKDWLVKYLPWFTLIGGLLSIWAAWSLWHWAHIANALINYANSLSQAFGGQTVATSRMTVGIWLGVIVLAVEAVVYLLAFPGLKAHKKAGWNMLFLGSIINVVYGVVVMFTDYGGAGNLIGALIGTIIGWWILFQIRDYYTGKKAPEATVSS